MFTALPNLCRPHTSYTDAGCLAPEGERTRGPARSVPGGHFCRENAKGAPLRGRVSVTVVGRAGHQISHFDDEKDLLTS